MEEDDERDEEVSETVEDDIAGHPDLGKVSPAPPIRLVCVTSHLRNMKENIVILGIYILQQVQWQDIFARFGNKQPKCVPCGS
jgi:hypothetical protein